MATALLLLALPDEYKTMKLALLFAAAAPVGANVAIFAQLYGQDYTVSMPVITLLMNTIG